jgi:PRC-barrel domain
MATTVDDRRETVSLIGSDKVEGTSVYGTDENKIGSVQRVMIDKISGKVAYAVISFGGFWGWGKITIRCLGRTLNTTRVSAVTASE